MERGWSVEKLAELLEKGPNAPEVIHNWKHTVPEHTESFFDKIINELKNKLVEVNPDNSYDGGNQERKWAVCIDRITWSLIYQRKIWLEVTLGPNVVKVQEDKSNDEEDLSKCLIWGLSIRKKYVDKYKFENINGFNDNFNQYKYKDGKTPTYKWIKGKYNAEELRSKEGKEDELVEEITEGIKALYKYYEDKLKPHIEGQVLNGTEGKVFNGTDGKAKSKISSILHALSTKPFLILAGVSGTGKTQIARIVAGVVAGEGKKQ
jgi:hypothetical protein